MSALRGAGVAIVLLVTLVGCGRYSFDTFPEPTFPTSSSPRPSVEPLERADVVGRWVVDGGPAGARLNLESRGTVTADDGCNSLGGARWSIVHGRVRLAGTMATTLVGCDRSADFLFGARTYRLEDAGDTLVAFDRDGREVGRLHRPR